MKASGLKRLSVTSICHGYHLPLSIHELGNNTVGVAYGIEAPTDGAKYSKYSCVGRA